MESTVAAYEATGVDRARWRVSAFLEDMAGEFAAADLILCRSGSSVAELAAAGKPSLLVPFPQAADDHQRKNAEAFARAGAAVMLEEREMSAERLLAELVGIMEDPARLARMSVAARGLAHPDALRRIGEMVRKIALPA